MVIHRDTAGNAEEEEIEERELGMLLDTIKFNSFIPAWVTLIFYSRWKGHGKATTCSFILLKSCMKQLKCS